MDAQPSSNGLFKEPGFLFDLVGLCAIGNCSEAGGLELAARRIVSGLLPGRPGLRAFLRAHLSGACLGNPAVEGSLAVRG